MHYDRGEIKKKGNKTMSVPGIMLENELKEMAGEHGIDKIGWFKSADFPMYLQAVESRKEYSLIEYRSLENF